MATLGRAALAEQLKRLRLRHPARWPANARAIRQSILDVRRQGWCAASWQPGVVSVAMPLEGIATPLMINVSVMTDQPLAAAAAALEPRLAELESAIREALSAQQAARDERP